MTTIVRINPRRWARLIQMLRFGEGLGVETVSEHPWDWEITLPTGETIQVSKFEASMYAEITPGVQAFISRVPLSPAPDSKQSDADDSDNAQPQSGGGDSRCEDAHCQTGVQSGSSSAVGHEERQKDEASSASDELCSSDSNGQAQSDSCPSGSEPQSGSSPETGAHERGSVQTEIEGAGKASLPDAPGGEEGTGGLARESAPSLPTGEVPAAGVVEAATENKGLNCAGNPFRISLRQKREHGGVFARLSDLDAQPSRALIHRARRVFARMIHGGEGDPGPRWQASRVAVKTAGYLRQWSVSDRREDDGRPALLILSDVSGSMAQYARDVLQFGIAVARIGLPGGEIVAVAQSNGLPEETLINGRVTRLNEDLRVYADVIARYDIRAVVIAADHDGAEIYHALYQTTTARFYWLHAYCSRVEKRVKIVRPGNALWPDWGEASRLRMAYGCGTAERSLEAMELLLNLGS